MLAARRMAMEPEEDFKPKEYNEASDLQKKDYFKSFENKKDKEEKIKYICTGEETEIARKFINDYLSYKEHDSVAKEIKEKIDDHNYKCEEDEWNNED